MIDQRRNPPTTGGGAAATCGGAGRDAPLEIAPSSRWCSARRPSSFIIVQPSVGGSCIERHTHTLAVFEYADREVGELPCYCAPTRWRRKRLTPAASEITSSRDIHAVLAVASEKTAACGSA